MQNQNRFTFIDFLIVLLAIGIILAILLPSFLRIPSERKELVEVVRSAIRGERVDVVQFGILQHRLTPDGDDWYTRALKQAGVTDKQIEVLRSGKLRVNLEP